jgi:hypothetical protein
MFKKYKITWIGWQGDCYYPYWGTRFNSGVPYSFFRIGPLMIKKYL